MKKSGIILLVLIFSISACVRQTAIPDQPVDINDILSLKNNCVSYNDCKLVNSQLSCSVCTPCKINYADEKYIAVNTESFAEFEAEYKKQNCSPNELDQGCPACEPFIQNQYYKAECINGMCTKVG